MHAAIAAHQASLQALCRRYGVTCLDVFGSAARAADFPPDRSDADFPVAFTDARRNDLTNFLDLRQANVGRALERNPITLDHTLQR